MSKKFALVGGLVAGIVIAGIVARKYFKKAEKAEQTAEAEANHYPGKTTPKRTKFEPRFIELYKKAQKIEFSSQFNNGTGYFDGCWTSEEGVKIPQGVSSFVSTDGRLAIVVKTEKGTTVMFQRYSDRRDILSICSDYNKDEELFFTLANILISA